MSAPDRREAVVMVATGTASEADLHTSSLEERARTLDAVPADRHATPMAGPAPGDVLKDRFLLEERVARGPNGQLFRAADRRLDAAGECGKRVALKVVTAEPGEEPRALRALRREAAIAQGLEHPNLPRILGIDHDGPHTFLCMDWLDGESLATILDSRGARPMTRVQAVHILEGVCRALAHLHDRDIVHADVKPGNILVTAGGDATLLDFGVALGPGTGNLPPVRGVTPEYASPDVLNGAEPTAADDLFSVACVAYRMLSGQRAFEPGNAGVAAATGARPPRPASVSPVQWRALDQALAFNRSERQPDVSTFIAQLKGGREDLVAAADLPATVALAEEADSPALPPQLRRHLPALAVLGCLLVGSIMLLNRRPTPPDPAATPATATIARPATATTSAAAPVALPSPGIETPPARESAPATEAARPPPLVAIAPERPRVPRNLTSRPAAPTPLPPAGELAGPPLPEAGPALPPETPPSPGLAAVAAPGTAATVAPTPALRKVPFSSLAIRNYVEADYPRNAATRRIAGWVSVAFTVDAAGRTRDLQVLGAEPVGLFEDAALGAVRRWRFAGGAAQPVRSEIRVRFDPR